MSRILITGATGFVGLPVARQLVAAGHSVTCVIRPGTDEKLEGLDAEIVHCDDVFDANRRLVEIDPDGDRHAGPSGVVRRARKIPDV